MMNFGRVATADTEPIQVAEAGSESSPRKVITLAFLAEHLLDSLISEQLARSLCAETGSSVVLVLLESRDGPGSLNDAVAPGLYLNGEFHLPPELGQTEAGFHALTLFCARSEPPTPSGLDSMLSQLSRQFRYVLVQTRVDESPPPWLFDLLLRSDLAYVFLRGAAQDIYHLEQLMREARTKCPNGGAHVKSIACLAENEQLGGLDLLIQRVAGPVHLFLRECPRLDRGKETSLRTLAPSRFRSDVRRLAREIGGCLVG